ncbi:hypothetical protein GCM10010266_72980 [Streptomyces griseomycini]|nr:hypothetical protein GCM10010266_72980 [Streptomyces griseomycini]GGR60321.1 hypothetical protein GCM10015536_75660 [Streptomyces griseomycini]
MPVNRPGPHEPARAAHRSPSPGRARTTLPAPAHRAATAPGSPGILRLCRNRVAGWSSRRRRPAPSADPAPARRDPGRTASGKATWWRMRKPAREAGRRDPGEQPESDSARRS